MEMEEGSASSAVAMATTEEGGGRLAASRAHRSLLVIGEIGTELRLDAAKQQIARGEWGAGGSASQAALLGG